MICRKCGNQIPDDSLFCPKCGACSNIDIENGDKVNLKKSDPQNNAQNYNNSSQGNIPADTNLKCPNCGKPLMPTWVKCMYCGVFNPFNSNVQPTANTTIVTPPPQVIIKHENDPQNDLQEELRKENIKETFRVLGLIVLLIVGFFLALSCVNCFTCLGCA